MPVRTDTGMRTLFGNSKAEALKSFQVMLEEYLGVPRDHRVSELSVIFVKAAASSVLMMLPTTGMALST